MILKCTCDHGYQDRVYGDKMRVHNLLAETSGMISGRCTVCSKENNKVGGADKKVKKGK